MNNSYYNFNKTSVFSQYANISFNDENNHYQSVVQYIAFQKAVLFEDTASAMLIITTKNPKKCKQLSRNVKDFNSEIWKEKKAQIVFNGHFYKFDQHKKIRKMLLETYPLKLNESDNYSDYQFTFIKNPIVKEKKDIRNLHGLMLMKVRDELMLRIR